MLSLPLGGTSRGHASWPGGVDGWPTCAARRPAAAAGGGEWDGRAATAWGAGTAAGC